MNPLVKKGIIIGLLVLIADQALKIWVKTHMYIGESSFLNWDWSFSWFQITFTENPGMAFGITTAALFLGLVPVFFVRFDMMVNVIMITVFSLISFGMLKYSLAGVSESVRNSQSNENAI